MPTVVLDGRSLVHYAAWKHHIGFYPLPASDGVLEQELAPYATAKGTGRFPIRDPMPLDLISRLVSLLVQQRADSDE